jgi:hypothetical protein
VETASIPAATLRAQLDRPLHRLSDGQTDISPPIRLFLPASPIHPCAVHGPLQSRPLGRKEQVD